MNDIQRFTANNITIEFLRFDNNYIVCFLDNLSENVLGKYFMKKVELPKKEWLSF